ncbi:hypothetical protein KTD18_07690 [Burkholderia multivorans]|uniref:hypothetical protein n=1 Tax=Burkholderia multivorans TaxID=87883 RepID=UPI0015E42025|nr:hypothetical protein [Burkholderia multivorans]MBU9291425.1 hypothetical protein [Burkholderia multivorans]
MKSHVTRQIEPIRCVRTGFMSIPSPKRPDLPQTPARRGDAPFRSTPILAAATISRRVARAKKRIPQSSAGSLTPHLKCECQSSSSFDKMGSHSRGVAARMIANAGSHQQEQVPDEDRCHDITAARPARVARARPAGGVLVSVYTVRFFWVGACHG